MSRSVKKPIGIFDSGVGGLTVMRAVAELLPHENLVYLGDTARVPYGNRSAKTVIQYAKNAVATLRKIEVKAIVVACNTASAFALDTLENQSTIPVIGVIEPVARQAAATTHSGSVGVIGTRGTIASQAYRRRLQESGVSDITEVACPLFVPLIEEGWTQGDVVEQVVNHYFDRFAPASIDTMILGCTHYPLLVDVLRRIAREKISPEVILLDSAVATAKQVQARLDALGCLASGQKGIARFLVTDDPGQFQQTATGFFGQPVGAVEHIDIRPG